MDDEFHGEMTFNFRLADGSPLVVTTGPYFKAHFGELLRLVRSKHGYVETIGFDARPVDHPAVVAETAQRRRHLHEARLARGWTPKKRPSA
jgi:hypothetical protein